MKKLKYFLLLLFVLSVFSFVFTQDNNRDYDSWFKKCEWLMIGPEKAKWDLLKSNQEKEDFIEEFFRARDPDLFTSINEFRKYQEERLKIADRDYKDLDDPRRYILLLFGKPSSKRSFIDERFTASDDPSIRINAGRGEIWEYKAGRKVSQVIFGQINLHRLELIRERYFRGEEVGFITGLSQSNYEIVHLGPRMYISIVDFLEAFFRRRFRLRNTREILNDQKAPILDRAKKFYKGQEPKVKREKRRGRYYSESLNAKVLIDLFGFVLGEPRINIWCCFDKNSLTYKKVGEYRADISLFCELRDENGKRIISYQKDSIDYKLSERRNYYYSFWGSLPPGRYKLILEIGEDITKRYKKFEVDVPVWSYAAPGLKVDLIAGKVFSEKQNWIQEKEFSPFSADGSQFLPLRMIRYSKGEASYFRNDDEVGVFFNVAGFQRDHYGNPYFQLTILFANKGKKVIYPFKPVKKVEGDIFEGFKIIKISDLIEKRGLSSGVYKVRLSTNDVAAGEEATITYPDKENPHLMFIFGSVENKDK